MKLESLKLGESFRLMLRTMPILLVRLGAMLGFWVAAIIYLAITGYVSFLIGRVVDWLGVILFIVALLSMIPLYQLAYRYVFYMIKAAHIAVISELLVRDSIPAGTSQLDWGRQRVTDRFGEMNIMFVVDELVNGVIKSFTRTVYRVTSFLPGTDSLQTLVRIVNRIVFYALTYVDEAVLARSFYRESDSPWTNARDGVVLYAQTWRPLLMNAIALMVISYLPFLAALLIFSAPIGFLLSLISDQVAGYGLIAILLFAWVIKVAVGDAFAMTAMIASYQRETADMKVNPEMAAQLDNLSTQFSELTQRARDEIAGVGRRSEAPADDDPAAAPPPVAPPPAPSAD